jgi:hypothetical protein
VPAARLVINAARAGRDEDAPFGNVTLDAVGVFFYPSADTIDIEVDLSAKSCSVSNVPRTSTAASSPTARLIACRPAVKAPVARVVAAGRLTDGIRRTHRSTKR